MSRTKTYTLHRWAYTKTLWGNEEARVPSRTWLLAFILYKVAKRNNKYNTWWQIVDQATAILYREGYVNDNTSNLYPVGRINVH
jgi:hypothetical protein